MTKKVLYCGMWSVALFVSTFYSLLGQEQRFDFEGKLLLGVAQSHIFPMIMAMTLYLMDVMYAISLRKTNGEGLTMWLLGTIIVFLLSFVFALMVNSNLWGWMLFIVAWLSLTVLKFVTTEEGESMPYIIAED